MKSIKKLYLGFGASFVFLLPIATTIACTNNVKEEVKKINQDEIDVQKVIDQLNDLKTKKRLKPTAFYALIKELAKTQTVTFKDLEIENPIEDFLGTTVNFDLLDQPNDESETKGYLFIKVIVSKNETTQNKKIKILNLINTQDQIDVQKVLDQFNDLKTKMRVQETGYKIYPWDFYDMMIRMSKTKNLTFKDLGVESPVKDFLGTTITFDFLDQPKEEEAENGYLLSTVIVSKNETTQKKKIKILDLMSKQEVIDLME